MRTLRRPALAGLALAGCLCGCSASGTIHEAATASSASSGITAGATTGAIAASGTTASTASGTTGHTSSTSGHANASANGTTGATATATGGSAGTTGTQTAASTTGSAAATSGSTTGYVPGGCTAILGCDGTQVTTLAGNGTYGLQDGMPGEFAHPQGIAVDQNGNLFVADSENQAVRMVDPSGNVTTLAGNGDAGFFDGTGGPTGTALLSYPTGVAVDSTGAVYIADQGNQRIRMITDAGNVITLAGNGMPAYTDGTGGPSGSASFDSPTGVAVDSSFDVYVADTGNRALRIVSGGVVTTLAQLSFGPNDVALDSNGNAFATVSGYILEVDSAGDVTTFAGSGMEGFQDGPAPSSIWSSALFGIAVDQGENVYVADLGNARVRRIDPYGYVSVVAGGGDGGVDGSGGIDGTSSLVAVGVAADAHGNLFTVDEGADEVEQLTLGCAPSGMPAVCCTCNCTVLATLQTLPGAIAADQSNVYWTNNGVFGTGSGGVYQMPVGGGPITTLANGAAGPLAIDQSNVYWADEFTDCDAGSGCPANSGTISQTPIGGGGPITVLATGQAYPTSIAVDSVNVYWSNEGDIAGSQGDAGGAVNAVAIGGATPPFTLVSGINYCGGMTVDTQRVYWTSNTDDTVMEMPIDGGAQTAIAQWQDNIYQVLVDSQSAYWWAYSYDGGTVIHDIMSVSLSGGVAGPLATGELAQVMAQDPSNLYWTDYGDGWIQSMPKNASTTPATLCDGQLLPEAIAVSNGTVFWGNIGTPGSQGGMILSMPLP